MEESYQVIRLGCTGCGRPWSMVPQVVTAEVDTFRPLYSPCCGSRVHPEAISFEQTTRADVVGFIARLDAVEERVARESTAFREEAMRRLTDDKVMRDTLTAAQARGTSLHNQLVASRVRASSYRLAAIRLADLMRANFEDRRIQQLQGIVRDLGDALKQTQHERKLAAEASDHGTWVWSETPDDDIESMGDDMLVTMAAAQLRALLQRAAARAVAKAVIPDVDSTYAADHGPFAVSWSEGAAKPEDDAE